MTHFAPGARARFAVQMQLNVRHGSSSAPFRFALLPKVAQEIRHRGRSQLRNRSQGQPAHRAQLLLKLAGYVRVEREVTRVVRTRRKLIDQQLAIRADEKFDTKDADDVQLFENGSGNLNRFRGDARGNTSRSDGDI